MRALPQQALSRLACPHCRAPLARVPGGFRCAAEERDFPAPPGLPLDLRLQEPLPRSLEVELGRGLSAEDFDFSPLQPCPTPELQVSGWPIPKHLSPELVSYLPRPRAPGALVLDLGCGDEVHRELCERAGFGYVGLDYGNPEASLLGDGQALPFREASFELVISIAVLEHVQHPLLLAREVRRVLEPGGRFLGTVAFLEPFHGGSYYHHTGLGTANTLLAGGLELERVAPSVNWTGPRAIADMAGPGVPFLKPAAAIERAGMRASDWLQRRTWEALVRFRAENAAQWHDALFRRAGSFAFVARRAAHTDPARLFHIAEAAAWEATQAEGQPYRTESLEQAGFIHLSRLGQVLKPANSLFCGREGLVLLAIAPERLKAELRWEDLYDEGEDYPHLYGALEPEAVVASYSFAPGAEGRFALPSEL